MSDAAHTILTTMSDHQAPVSGWDMPTLRRLTGLSIGNFAAGVSKLRAQGKMLAFELALTPAADVAPAAPSIKEQVDAEARGRCARRSAARMVGLNNALPPSIGAELQEKALTDAPTLAMGIVRDRWATTWDAVCKHARATNQRPVVAMIDLLNRSLQQGASA